MKNQLTNEIKIAISNELISLCDQATHIESQLRNQNIAAFDLLREFEGSFGDLESHLQYEREEAKEHIGSYNGSLYDEKDETFSIYKSNYIQQLTEEREQTLEVSFEEYKKSRPPAWEYYLDISGSNQQKMQLTNPQEFTSRKAKFDDKMREFKEKERQLNAHKSLINNEEFKQLDARQSIANILTEKLNQAGFELNSRFSSKTIPVFSKSLTENYYLCCSLNNVDETFIQYNRGIVKLVFHLRNSKCRKAKVETSPHTKINGHENFMILFSNEIIPHFEYSYCFFKSPEEFEQNVDAQVALFQILFEAIEDKVYEVLGNNSQ